KGFTAEVFEKQLQEKVKTRSGVDRAALQTAQGPDRAEKLLPELVESSKQTGVGYKGFTPAHFGTQAAAAFSAKTSVNLKQTTTDSLLRNSNNKADDFETGMLKKFADASYPRQGDKIMAEEVESGKSVRVMLPLY